MYGARCEVGAEGVLVGIAEACQQNGGERTFGKTEVVVLCCSHTVDVDRDRGIIASVIRGITKVGRFR